MTFFKSLMLGTALATIGFTAAQAQDRKVSEIDVVMQFTAADANALEFYPTLETDLEQRLGEALAPVMDGNGGRLVVFVKGVTVDGSAILTESSAFNTLEGGVQYFPVNPDKSSGASSVNPKVTDIRVVGVAEMPTLIPATIDPAGPAYLVLPSDQTVYEVMIDKFAEVVAERLPDMENM